MTDPMHDPAAVGPEGLDDVGFCHDDRCPNASTQHGHSGGYAVPWPTLQTAADALAAARAEVGQGGLPCDGLCSANSGPEEDCSRHGRPVAEVWQIAVQVTAERDAARAALARVEALVDDMDERGRPGVRDSDMDTASRRQIREDVKRIRAALAAAPSETVPVYEVSPGAFMTVIYPGRCSGYGLPSETGEGR